MGLSKLILRLARWHVDITVPTCPKCIICVAPHTSNWDFIIGLLAYWSVGRKAGFLMKETWFFPPLGWIFRAMGGIPVPRRRHGSLTQTVVRRFDEAKTMHLAITPEGTRSRTANWHTGFLHIAREANVPVELAVIDFKTRVASITTSFIPTGDVEADMAAIKRFYRASMAQGRYPEKFTAD